MLEFQNRQTPSKYWGFGDICTRRSNGRDSRLLNLSNRTKLRGFYERVPANNFERNESETGMVPITREEKILLRKKYPDLCVARTMKQDSKRKHYYCEERAGAMAYLEKIRQKDVVYDSRYPDGKPPKQEDRAVWQKGDKRGNKSGGWKNKGKR